MAAFQHWDYFQLKPEIPQYKLMSDLFFFFKDWYQKTQRPLVMKPFFLDFSLPSVEWMVVRAILKPSMCQSVCVETSNLL